MNLSNIDPEVFVTEEIVACVLRANNINWRPAINYADISQPRLRNLSYSIPGIVDGVIAFKSNYTHLIDAELIQINVEMEQIPEEHKLSMLSTLLLAARLRIFSQRPKELSTFFFMAIVTEMCEWLIEFNHEDLISNAAFMIRMVLNNEFSERFQTVLQRLEYYINGYHYGPEPLIMDL